MFLTASRPDTMFAVCACARDSPFDLEAFSNSDYAGASLDRNPYQKTEQDETVYKEWEDKMERAATTASSLEAEQDSGNINRIPIHATHNEPRFLRNWFSVYTTLVEHCGEGDRKQLNINLMASLYKTGEGSTVPVESYPTPTSAPSTSQPPTTPPSMQTTYDAEEPATMPYDSSHLRVQSLGSEEDNLSLNELTVLYTTLSKKIQEDVEIQGRTSADTEILLDQEEPTELVEDLGSGEKGEKEISTVNISVRTKKDYSSALTKLILRVKKLKKKVKTNKARRRSRIVISEDEDAEEDSSKQGRKISEIDKDPTISLVQPEQDMEYDFDVSTAEGFTTASVPVTTTSATPEVSTAVENLVYIRRSAEKRKDNGIAIMKEDEFVQKKTKKQLEKERLGHEEAVRFQEQINEEERQRIARDAEIAKQSFSKAEVRKNMCIYLKNQGGYKLSHFKGMKNEDIRRIFERVWDQNNAFVPKDSEIEKEVMKRPGFDFQQKSSKNRSREDSDEDNAKKQKLEDDAEKKELRDSMDVVLRDDIAIDVESLATKYLIVDWKTHVLIENMMYYQIIRGDGSSKNYKIFSEMLDDFDRQDVLDLHRLVQERYDTTSPEGYDLLLWGDLKILFEPNEEDEIWKNQQDYNLISWRLFDSCGIHMLLMHTGIAIHMMIEKKYPLTQEMLSRMLSRRLEVDQESEMAFELLRFIRSQLQK
ncbi:hypothetical protein Tco_0066172 [Tanacetum coccineum]